MLDWRLLCRICLPSVLPTCPPSVASLSDDVKKRPILEGVTPFKSKGSLYKNTGLSKDVDILLTGSIPGHQEPVAWTRLHQGARIFYTSLGHPDDFKNDNFRRLLVNALFWTTKRDIPSSAVH